MISLIVAMSENRVIGRENRLPWHLPEDLHHFKGLTLGHPIVMGRKTFESIGRVLPGRTNVILSRRRGFKVPGAIVLESFEEALASLAREPGGSEIFVVGGADVYRQALPRADRVYLTIVHAHVEGDATFPELPSAEFVETERVVREGALSFEWRVYERVRAGRPRL